MPKVARKNVHIKEYMSMIKKFYKKAGSGESKVEKAETHIERALKNLQTVTDLIDDIQGIFLDMRHSTKEDYNSNLKPTPKKNVSFGKNSSYDADDDMPLSQRQAKLMASRASDPLTQKLFNAKASGQKHVML